MGGDMSHMPCNLVVSREDQWVFIRDEACFIHCTLRGTRTVYSSWRDVFRNSELFSCKRDVHQFQPLQSCLLQLEQHFHFILSKFQLRNVANIFHFKFRKFRDLKTSKQLSDGFNSNLSAVNFFYHMVAGKTRVTHDKQGRS